MLDVAARVGCGVGSYGVERFYVLLAGEESKRQEGVDIKQQEVSGNHTERCGCRRPLLLPSPVPALTARARPHALSLRHA